MDHEALNRQDLDQNWTEPNEVLSNIEHCGFSELHHNSYDGKTDWALSLATITNENFHIHSYIHLGEIHQKINK